MHALVVVDETSGADALQQSTPIVHTASPRLFVVSVEPNALGELAQLAGVVAVTTGELPADVAARLDTFEAMFATAFAAGQSAKERLGEGLPWDADGFEPPDAAPSSANRSAESRPDTEEGRESYD